MCKHPDQSNNEESPEPITSRSWLPYAVLLAVVMITALALRLDGLTRSLEYDEIWPWREFSAMTPFDTLVHPRDVRHPLTNMISTLVPAAVGPGDQHPSEILMRLGSLIAGLLLVPAAALLATALTRRRSCGILAAALVAVDPVLIHFSQTLRGYVFEALFAVLLCWWLQLHELRLRRQAAWCLGLALLTVLLQLSVITAVLIWAPLFAWLTVGQLVHIRRGTITWRSLLPAFITMVFLSLAFLFWLLKIRSGLTHSIGLGSPAEVAERVLLPLNLVQGLTLPALTVATALAAICLIRRRVVHLAVLLLCAAAAFTWVTGSVGPMRVYSYLVPFILLPVAVAVDALLGRLRGGGGLPQLTGMTAALLVVGWIFLAPDRSRWEQLDVRALIPVLLEHDAYLVFAAGTGRLVNTYAKTEVVQHNFMHMFRPSETRSMLLVNCSLHGMTLGAYSLRGDKDCALALTPETAGEPLSPGNVSCVQIDVRTARAADSNGILFAVVTQPSSTFAEWEAATFDNGGASRWCILNPWLTRTVFVASRDQQGEPGKYINAVFCTAVDSADDGAAARGMLADAAFYWLQQ